MHKKIKTTCARCGKDLLVPEQAAGKSILCRACREKMQTARTVAANTADETQTTTVQLQQRTAATKVIRDVFKIEPSIDLSDTTTEPLPPGAEARTDAVRKSIGAIISQAHKDTKYIIDRQIGKGGMGAVLGTIDQDIRRKVAMKVMLPKNRRDTPKIRRFLEEAQVTGQLEHPNIVPVHEIGIDEKANVYFTMKLVQGENLEAVIGKCRRGNEKYLRKYTLGALLQLFMKVCDGMSYAHAKGVLHRDLKPENIMIGGFGEALIMDWGLAKIVGQEEEAVDARGTLGGDARHPVTAEGKVMGTPAYMSPEQACGHISELDKRSDLFSLGGILYKILTFSHPYEGKTIQESLELAQNHELVPPDQRSPERNIPPELAAICMKAMAYDKDDRYADATEINHDLQLYLDGKSVSAKRDSLVTKASKWIARNKVASAGIAAAVICLVAGMVAATLYQHKLRREKIAGMLQRAAFDIESKNFESAETTYFAVLGVDGANQDARSGISRVSGKALAAKNKRLAERTVKEADLHYKNESYQRAYDAYVATLTLDPESQWAKVKIQASAVMADKQKAQAKAAPILEQAKAVQVELTGVRSEINRLQADIKAMQQRIRGFEDQKAKQPLWDAQKALSAANIAKLQKESSLISAFFTVLSYDGANPEARRGLSKIYYDRYTAGESENDREAMSFYRSLVLTFDDGRYRTLLEQGGNLTITSDPPADGYYLHRFEEGVDRRLVPLAFDPRTPFPIEGKDDEAEPEAKITPMPSLRAALRFDDADRLDRIGDIELPAGSYLVTIKKGGFMDTRVPVMIRRGESSRITAIRLFREKEVPRGFVYVPKGPCLLGGDHAAPYPLDRNVRDIPGFFVSRHEVTAQEYLAFINDMEKRIPGSAEKYLPRKASKSGPYWKKVGAHYENNFPENWPVLGISWNDARAFCKWMTHRHKREGWVFRLPEEWEWEKAARGVDGRYFPWGNHFDFTFCSMANSKKKKRNGPDPVGSFTPDESVYGVMDMAGNVSEWCHTFYDRQNNIRINRGAAWSYAEADYARCAARNGHSPSAVADFRGFRMVASMPER